jgi:hypothetical protein
MGRASSVAVLAAAFWASTQLSNNARISRISARVMAG